MERQHFSIHLHHQGCALLTHAILMYREAQTSPMRSYASIHDIDLSGDAPMILPGRAATPAALLHLTRTLSQSVRHTGYIPDNVLYADGDTLVWWVPPARRHIAFRCEQWDPSERAAVLPHPGLVFLSNKRNWMVWSVKGKRRPALDTALYRAPYFNVYSNGEICAGNVVLPKTNAFDQINHWNDVFFHSHFTHTNAPGALVEHAGGAYAFWRAMLDAPPVAFPGTVLVRPGITLQQILPQQEKHHA
jgi:PRTRC genetic system protein B